MTHLAKVDFSEIHEIEILCIQLEGYIATLVNHGIRDMKTHPNHKVLTT